MRFQCWVKPIDWSRDWGGHAVPPMGLWFGAERVTRSLIAPPLTYGTTWVSKWGDWTHRASAVGGFSAAAMISLRSPAAAISKSSASLLLKGKYGGGGIRRQPGRPRLTAMHGRLRPTSVEILFPMYANDLCRADIDTSLKAHTPLISICRETFCPTSCATNPQRLEVYTALVWLLARQIEDVEFGHNSAHLYTVKDARAGHVTPDSSCTACSDDENSRKRRLDDAWQNDAIITSPGTSWNLDHTSAATPTNVYTEF